ncbi:RNA-directed DNA polymerase, eukaryota, reverse transcriptase zinc-binding domain protein [Tanacetum coccineum]
MRNESMNTEEYEGDTGLNCNEVVNNGGNGSNSRDHDAVDMSNVKAVETNEDLNDLLNEGDVRKNTVSEINDDFINVADHNTDNVSGNKNENVKSGDCIGNDIENKVNIKQSSYAKTLTKNMSNGGNQLFTVPTGTSSKGEEVVLFDEELVREGSEKWKLTVCGYFVGCKMQVYELKYNVRRMWGRFRLKDIVVDAEGMCFFKFKEEEGMKYVIDQSPWIVNEAWSIKGLSAISSRLGRPLMMDQMTSDTCKEGSCRLRYARVLVEIDASKSYLNKIEINYVDDEKKVKMSKWVRVEYSWKPDRCCYCNVFGHSSNYCKSKLVVSGDNGKKNKENMNHLDNSKEGFVEVKNMMKNRNEANGSMNTGLNGYRQGNSRGWDQHQVKYAFIPKVPAPKPTLVEPRNNQSSPAKTQTPYKEKGWKVSKKNIEELKKSANKFVVLSEDENVGEGEDPFIDKRLIVDEFVRKKVQPSCSETKDWTHDMIQYSKYAWEAMERKENDLSDEEDVYVNMNQVVNDLIADEILVKDVGGIKIKKFIDDEKLQVCAILKTHLKVKSIKKACNWVFGNWNWVSNVDHSPACSRIVIGWNSLLMDVMIVYSCRQAILCLIESVDKKMGDFNVILKPEEQSNGPSGLNNDMIEFRDAVNSLEIDDLCSSGFNFTWTNSLKNTLTSTLKKLDRIMINDQFINVYEKSHGEITGCNMYKVVQKLKCLKKPLRKLSWKNGNLFEKVVDLRIKLMEVQRLLDADRNNMFLKEKCVDIGKEYADAAEDELKLLHQKARVHWLKEGDKNSAYFHSILKTRKNKSRVESICKEDGTRVVGEMVPEQFVNHFKDLLGKSQHVQALSNMENYVQAKLTEEEALDMIKMVTDDEIKTALFDIDSSKAVGPDGFTSCFFKKAWSYIGKDICLAIKDFFQNGKMLGEINATLIALVPKIHTPDKVFDFRPIACCNVLYKCISKILTYRINDGLSYNRKNGPKRCAMKIDIQKAYDTVYWDFLRNTLQLVGFREIMIKWIMTCVTIYSFSICINGEICGFFKGGKGLRQGDPISPYLFTLVMEVFNMIMIKNIDEAHSFKYHYGCKELKLTHMCFADDLMVLCNGDKESLEIVKKSLKDFSNVSGLFPNLNKSIIFFGSLSEERKRELLELIATVLSAMQQYWALVYMLPMSVIHDLEKIFKRFLWNSGRKKSLWVKWVNVIKLKGKSIWETECCHNDSWRWKFLLEIRNKIKPYVKYKIGNGKGVSMWYDNWSNIGPLNNIIPKSARNAARMKDSDSVADLVKNDVWDWPLGWLEIYPICNTPKIGRSTNMFGSITS